ncbi:MAG: hypothetical protein ACUVSK_01060, partial [Desulfotomaculales bacterium]
MSDFRPDPRCEQFFNLPAENFILEAWQGRDSFSKTGYRYLSQCFPGGPGGADFLRVYFLVVMDMRRKESGHLLRILSFGGDWNARRILNCGGAQSGLAGVSGRGCRGMTILLFKREGCMMGKRKRKKKALPKNRMRNITSSSLEDKIKKSGLFRGKNFTLVKGTGEKMSEVLLDFAEPLLDKLEDYPTIEKAI